MSCRPPVLLLLAALATAAPALPGAAAADTIRVGGTGSALKTLQLVGAVFARAEGGSVVVMPNLGSEGGIKALQAGAIDLAVVSQAPAAAAGLRVVEYARTPFVFAVGREPVRSITLQQVVDLYSGRTTRWPGGEPVRVVLRQDYDVDNAVMRAMSPALSQALDLALRRKGMVTAFSDQEAADLIAGLPGGIGPTTLAIIKAERYPLKALELDGVAPAVDTLAEGRYPYFKSFHAVFRTSAPEAVARFVAFLRSPSARPLLEDLGQRQVAD